eukprot:scpid41050/ scgid4659/ Heparanase; Endo-glucoronidase; Heparanase-1; Heparanase 8 kDa subunit; Heparanase 50 kDa subunit
MLEPDLYYEHTGELVVSGGQLAEDFRVLADYLKDTTDSYSLCGPDVATLDRGHFFQTFLNKTAEIGVGPNVITWHQYYGSGRTFKLEDFYSADVLDKLIAKLGTVKDMLKDAGLRHAEVAGQARAHSSVQLYTHLSANAVRRIVRSDRFSQRITFARFLCITCVQAAHG